jgi:hypothetical protein
MKSGIWVRRAVAIFAAAILSVAGTTTLRADDEGAQGRAVRLSNVDGEVQVSQGGEVLADHAVANTPLFEGSQITTGEDGRAEIQFEDGSVARIPPDSSLTISVLKPGDTELRLDSGIGYFELQDGNESNTMRVGFGPHTVTASGFTVIRVKLDEGAGDMAVFSGNAHIDGTNGASMDVRGGESVALNNLNLSETIEPDSWDAWNSDRDQALTTADVGSTPATSNMPDNENPAWNDLNSNGTWYNVPDQGSVWSPYDASNPGFDPYGVGYWMWTPRFGYVWVSGYSWGYMPFQCGAWNWYNSFGWGWAPGMCNTWWGGGGWGFNIGIVPTWYRLPVRPHPPMPRNPRPVGPIEAGGGRGRSPIGLRPLVPVIAVNRREPAGTTPLPPREPNHPVLIGGVVAQPLRPNPPRESNLRHITPITGRPLHGSSPIETGTMRQGYMPAPRTGTAGPGPVRPVTRPGYVPAPVARPGYAPFEPGRGPGNVTAPRPAPAPSVGYRPAPAPRPSGGAAPRPAPSGGGARPSGAGGGGHPAGGGGGGGHPAAGPHK